MIYPIRASPVWSEQKGKGEIDTGATTTGTSTAQHQSAPSKHQDGKGLDQ